LNKEVNKLNNDNNKLRKTLENKEIELTILGNEQDNLTAQNKKLQASNLDLSKTIEE
jgi:hypothetical protein